MKFILLFFVTCSAYFAQQAPKTIADILTPSDFKRVTVAKGSFAEFLRNLRLKQQNSIVYLYNGKPKANQEAQYAVLEIDVGKEDLQQCADAIIRLKAEYHFARKEFDKISFHFLNGKIFSFIDYAEGYRVRVKNSNVVYTKLDKKDYSYSSFRKYLNIVFNYANTSSLKRYDSRPLNKEEEIEIGDILIQEKVPFGHAVIIVDKAVNLKNEKVYLLAQSYMPAQEIHILKNRSDPNLNPWYKLNQEIIHTPEWKFYKKDLSRLK